MTNDYPYYDTRIRHITSLYKKARPDGEVFVSLLGYGGMVDDLFIKAAKRPDMFAESVARYLKKFNLDGVDIDWESPQINQYAPELITLLKAISKISKVTHAVVPGLALPEIIGKLRDLVDSINIMSYQTSTDSIEYVMNEYNASGLPYHKMAIGIDTESRFETMDTVRSKLELAHKYNATVFEYRFDNDIPPFFNTTTMIDKVLHEMKSIMRSPGKNIQY